MAVTSKGYRTYKLVEIPVNGQPISTNLSCGLNHQKFIIGNLYKISTKVIEREFKCVAYIDVTEENPEECLDIVVMKQTNGPLSMIWPLSEDECEFLHIEYQNGLLVFPATYNFKSVG